MLKFILLNSENVVISIRYGEEIASGEIKSDIGELGQIMQPDGTFINSEQVIVEPQPNEPTNSEIAQMISDLQADLIIAGVI